MAALRPDPSQATISVSYEGVTGEPYDEIQYFFSGTQASGYTKSGWELYYADQASGLTQIDFDGSGNLTHEFYTFGGTPPGTLTGIEIDYVAGQEADSLYTEIGPGSSSFTTGVYEADGNPGDLHRCRSCCSRERT